MTTDSVIAVQGNVAVLRSLGAERGFSGRCGRASLARRRAACISTSIRRAVAGGDLDARGGGTRRVVFRSGKVIAGNSRGEAARIRHDQPRAAVCPRKLLPPRVSMRYGADAARPFGGMMNLGPRPTFGDQERSIEAHLFDVEADFYGMRVRIDFVRIPSRDQKFARRRELVRQLERDRENALRALTPFGGSDNLKGSIQTVNSTPSVA